MPTVPEGGLNQREDNFFTLISLNEHAGYSYRKICRYGRRIVQSEAYQWTADRI